MTKIKIYFLKHTMDHNENYKYISRKQIYNGKLNLVFAQKSLTVDDDRQAKTEGTCYCIVVTDVA